MQNLKKTIFIGFIVGVILFIIDLTFYYLSGNTITLNQNLLIKFGYYQMYSIVLTLVNGYFFDYLYSNKWVKYAKYKLVIGIFGGIIITMFTIILLRMVQEMAIKGEGFEEFYIEEFQNGAFYLTALFIQLLSLYFFMHFIFIEHYKRKK